MTCVGNSSDINQVFVIEPLSITGGSPTLSACTALYSNEIISCSGNTHIILSSGYTEFSHDVIVNGVYYSGGTNLYNVITSAITENDVYVTGATFSGATLILSRRDNVDIYAKFTGNTSGDCVTDLFIENLYGCSPITLHDDLNPFIDATINLGTPIKRFRNINTVSGVSTVWTSTTSVTTAALELGLDSLFNIRTITANNSIIQNDILDGNSY
jgi:hypothetical protein